MSLLQCFSFATILLPGIPAMYYTMKPPKTYDDIGKKRLNLLAWNSATLLTSIPALWLSSSSAMAKYYGIGFALLNASDMIHNIHYHVDTNTIPSPTRAIDILLTFATVTYSVCWLYYYIFG